MGTIPGTRVTGLVESHPAGASGITSLVTSVPSITDSIPAINSYLGNFSSDDS